jgi:hypothetical protein
MLSCFLQDDVLPGQARFMATKFACERVQASGGPVTPVSLGENRCAAMRRREASAPKTAGGTYASLATLLAEDRSFSTLLDGE